MSTSREHLSAFMITTGSILLRMINVSEKKIVEEAKTYILCSGIFFFRKSCFL